MKDHEMKILWDMEDRMRLFCLHIIRVSGDKKYSEWCGTIFNKTSNL